MLAGESIGLYRVLEKIGAGGMGDVYKAHDARLGRDVALKISHEAFSDRFTREARSIAALNHTNICHLYDVGPDHLVMEYVEGEDLAATMKAHGSGLAFDEALPIINQLIDGIEAAHERNIIHRDLKPANIKVTPDGVVKILDFGLAKALHEAGEAGGPGKSGGASKGELSQSPTMMSPAFTQAGMILGTAAYMAPEQARGRDADRRADIWAFGVIVYELVTGKALFEGETPIEVLGQVMHKPVNLSGVPSRVRKLLEWCLEKERKDRLQSIGDARRLLRDATVEPATPGTPQTRSATDAWMARAGWLVAAIAFVALASVIWRGRSSGDEPPFMRLAVPLPGNTAASFLALSPDGRSLVFAQSNSELMIRAFDSSAVRPLSGTRGARMPFWSPDSKTVAFFSENALKTIPASGGPLQTLCREVGTGNGGTWSQESGILFSTSAGALKRVQPDGGTCSEIRKSDALVPVFLPDGKHFLYVKGSRSQGTGQLVVASLDDVEGSRLLPDASSGLFVPGRSEASRGHVLFRRGSALTAQAFDPESLQLSGDPFVVAEDVAFTNSPPQLAATVSRTGTVAFLSNAAPNRQIVLYDESGKALRTVAGTGLSGSAISITPDGKSVAFVRSDGLQLESHLVNFESRQDSRLFSPPLAPVVVWSHDASRIAFSGTVDGREGVYTRSVGGGTPQLLLETGDTPRVPSDWSRDDRWIVYTEYNPKTLGDIWLLPVTPGASAKPVLLVRTPGNESQAQISPNGKWLAYYSNEDGSGKIYLRPLTADMRAADTAYLVGSGVEPRWQSDGKHLFYLERTDGTLRLKMVAVPIADGPGNPAGTPRRLFEISTLVRVQQLNTFCHQPLPDGKSFLVNVFETEPQPTLDVLVNWKEK